MKKKYLFLVCFILMLSYQISYASEPFDDPSGMIQMPQAYLKPQGQFSVAYNSAAIVEDTNKWSKYHLNSQGNVSFHYNPYQNLQMGIASVVDRYQHTHAGVSLKYQILAESTNAPAVAIGGSNMGIEDLQSFYLISTRRIGNDCTLSMGVGNGVYSFGDGNMRWFKGLLAGLKWDFGQHSFFTELSGTDINIGSKINIGNNINLNLAVCEIESASIGRSKVTSKPRLVVGFDLGELFVNKAVLIDTFKDSAVASAGQSPASAMEVVKTMNQSEFVDVPLEGQANKVSVSFAPANRSEKKSAAVMINNIPVIKLAAVIDSFNEGKNSLFYANPSDRAHVIADRIEKLILQNKLGPLTPKMINNHYVGVSEDELIFTITHVDAYVNKMSEAELNNKWIQNINAVINKTNGADILPAENKNPGLLRISRDN
ncbi:MAG: hypothetical protein DKM50_08540 [Candidatus Margulisiibacteriota bacterium]|nr:MAG: hypothetical protein A2X43_11905 [Candidatus Margulisbacteria bacterium GWD2_39_127]OGI01843.1 MAG: hypothetical protein A2X42_04430 [Candidatus Margulisbacteria bacterium GWF2_38_17]OGI10165.1 MAG: hypothetical protein A2X41_01150 [Candidatus Margulisbacteria bacterium GWE2_39_32]PZM79498.1 MAG: hypothetical protein DKM50_08540 [Candidatus Margulisiibacteriota bacterium]HAR63831.1 hypothetical protein [Candidatus Margulisiibacteriota bacterium]